MENQAFIDSLMREIIQPGVDQLMNSRYFTELRKRFEKLGDVLDLWA